jgi:hypothetical protein
MEARADTQVRKLASGKLRGTPSIDSLAINPVTPDIVYAGTGDPNVACCFVGSGLGRVSLTRWRKHLDCGRLKPKPDRLRRSPGVPYVSVTDLEVQQVFQAHDHSGVVRAGTYGRGVFELNRASSKGPIEKPPLVLSVQAIHRLEDDAPSYPTVQIPVTFEGGKLARETPFELAPAKGMEVTLDAPEEVRANGVELKFAG